MSELSTPLAMRSGLRLRGACRVAGCLTLLATVACGGAAEPTLAPGQGQPDAGAAQAGGSGGTMPVMTPASPAPPAPPDAATLAPADTSPGTMTPVSRLDAAPTQTPATPDAARSSAETGAPGSDAASTEPPPPTTGETGLGRSEGYPGWLPTTSKRGWVIIYQNLGGGGGFHFFEFYTGSDARRGQGCTFRRSGPCVVRACPAGSPASSTEPGDGTFVDAGLVTIAGDKGKSVMRDWSFAAGSRYYNRHHDGRTWVNDEKLTATAAGATVPGFTFMTWTYPARIANVSASRIDRKTGGSFKWDLAMGSAGNVVFNLGGSPNVTCWGPAAAKSLVIPPDVAAELTPGERTVLPTTADLGNLRVGEFNLYVEAKELRYPELKVAID